MMLRLLHFQDIISCFTVIQLKTVCMMAVLKDASHQASEFDILCVFLYCDVRDTSPSFCLPHPTLSNPRPPWLSLYTTGEPSHWKIRVFNFQITPSSEMSTMFCVFIGSLKPLLNLALECYVTSYSKAITKQSCNFELTTSPFLCITFFYCNRVDPQIPE